MHAPVTPQRLRKVLPSEITAAGNCGLRPGHTRGYACAPPQKQLRARLPETGKCSVSRRRPGTRLLFARAKSAEKIVFLRAVRVLIFVHHHLVEPCSSAQSAAVRPLGTRRSRVPLQPAARSAPCSRSPKSSRFLAPVSAASSLLPVLPSTSSASASNHRQPAPRISCAGPLPAGRSNSMRPALPPDLSRRSRGVLHPRALSRLVRPAPRLGRRERCAKPSVPLRPGQRVPASCAGSGLVKACTSADHFLRQRRAVRRRNGVDPAPPRRVAPVRPPDRRRLPPRRARRSNSTAAPRGRCRTPSSASRYSCGLAAQPPFRERV